MSGPESLDDTAFVRGSTLLFHQTSETADVKPGWLVVLDGDWYINGDDDDDDDDDDDAEQYIAKPLKSQFNSKHHPD